MIAMASSITTAIVSPDSGRIVIQGQRGRQIGGFARKEVEAVMQRVSGFRVKGISSPLLRSAMAKMTIATGRSITA
jgi:hypothetical protein